MAQVNGIHSPRSLETALAEAQEAYSRRNPNSLLAHKDACRSMPGGNTCTPFHASPFPITFKSGESCKLTSVDNDIYTDFLGDYTAGIYGHNNPEILTAVQEALANGYSYGGNNVYEKELAKHVCERFQPVVDLVRFTNSGTEANMMALATAIAFTGRKKILVFNWGYHGCTISFPVYEGLNTNAPHEWIFAEYNDIPNTLEVLSQIPKGSLAAILVEPMQGAAGAIAGRPDFLTFLRNTATELGAVLIFDEVMTSRLSYRGLSDKLRIRPDMMTLGKYIGGGMSSGAFGGRRDIMAMYDPMDGPLSHAGTFNNNVASMAAGCAGCKLLNPETIDALNELGETMMVMVNDVFQRHGIGQVGAPKQNPNGTSSTDESEATRVHEVSAHARRPEATGHDTALMRISGIGSIMSIHFAGDSQEVLHSLFFHHMLQENIYLAARGFIALSIEIKLEHVRSFADAVDRFVVKYKPFLAPQNDESDTNIVEK